MLITTSIQCSALLKLMIAAGRKGRLSNTMAIDLKEARKEIRETDRMMTELFRKRMEAVRSIAAYKKEHGLPVTDEEQEKKVLELNSSYIKDDVLRQYYLIFMKNTIAVSRQYQEDLIKGDIPGIPGIPGIPEDPQKAEACPGEDPKQ